jgi:hypothetical protein
MAGGVVDSPANSSEVEVDTIANLAHLRRFHETIRPDHPFDRRARFRRHPRGWVGKQMTICRVHERGNSVAVGHGHH